MASMYERRSKRSAERVEALQYLVETVADRSGVRALVLMDDLGHILAGMGHPKDVVGLAGTALDVAWGRASVPEVDAAASGEDVTARPVATPEGMVYFAAIGDRVAGVGDAVRAVQRIYSETLPS
ncbi:MAG: hypothetical protein ACREJ3_12445 [Polyangiaceae bacterium]